MIKFAGDALLSVWRATDTSEAAKKEACFQCALAAIQMQEEMSDYVSQGVRLTLHSGSACGWLNEMHLGGHNNRWEYMVAGSPINLMGEAVEVSSSGQAVIHREMWKYLSGDDVSEGSNRSRRGGRARVGRSSRYAMGTLVGDGHYIIEQLVGYEQQPSQVLVDEIVSIADYQRLVSFYLSTLVQ